MGGSCRGEQNKTSFKKCIELASLCNEFSCEYVHEDTTNPEKFCRVIILKVIKKQWEIMGKSGNELLELVHEMKDSGVFHK